MSGLFGDEVELVGDIKLSKYIKGEIYEFTSNDCVVFSKGDRVRITEDNDFATYEALDGSDRCSGHDSEIRKVQTILETPQEPTVVDMVTVKFSDGVTIATNDVTFDGKTWDRKDLRATIKRYTEILNRPLPKVPQPGDPVRAKKTVKKPVKKASK
jgi:hypothetical protein